MNSSMIGKIEKAHRYAREPERITFETFTASFRGSHDDYTVSLTEHGWECTCHTFETHMLGTCSHIMAIQHILGGMLPDRARYDSAEAGDFEAVAS
jgi:hypothetical protein